MLVLWMTSAGNANILTYPYPSKVERFFENN